MKIEHNSVVLEQLSNGNYAVGLKDFTGHIGVGIFFGASEMDDLLHVMVDLWKQTDQYKNEATK